MSRRLSSRAAALLLVLGAASCAADDSVETIEGPGIQGPEAAPEVRPDTPGNNLQFNFEPGDVVETFTSSDGKFLIHYTTSGPNAVPAMDGDASGIPDFVETVAGVYVEVITFYEGLGFRAPEGDGAIADNGGDGKFDVYLVDFAGVGDGAFREDSCLPTNGERCIGFMTQENDFVGYGYPSWDVGASILGSHEFFHAVQAAYDHGQGSVFAEGSAVWATEAFDPSLNDFEGFVPGFLENPDRPLDSPLPGPVDPFSYGAGLFFKFLDERFGRDTIRVLFERCENGANGDADPYWMEQLEPALQDTAGTGFAEALVDFATWNLRTDDFADPAVAYVDGLKYPRVKIDEVTLPFSDDQLRAYYASTQYRAAAPDGRGAMTAALVSSDAAMLEGMALVIATENGTDVESATVADPTAGTQTLDTGGADRFVVAVINTHTSGDSLKPGLCIGTTEEVAACKDAILSGGTGGAGGGGTGGAGTGGSGGGAVDGDTSDEGCGCAVGPGAEAPPSLALSALAALAIVGARRARRRAAR